MTALQRSFVVAVLVLFGLGAVVSPFGMVASLFMFDAPGSLENPITISLAMALWCYPVVYVYGAVSSIRRLRRGERFRRAMAPAALPLLPTIWFALSLAALEFFCHGNFACSGS